VEPSETAGLAVKGLSAAGGHLDKRVWTVLCERFLEILYRLNLCLAEMSNDQRRYFPETLVELRGLGGPLHECLRSAITLT
jgi:hypothetical protein